ncbi:alanine racemase [Mesorhizobium sp. L-8-10]|uniref:alanine racemase n=1 Tax=unclassified Mesorhizobium TaxID=325217 RepID=UPI001926F57C|nr:MULTISPECIES: alanine racemase [unclassified Mesorhizobium]BCH21886.1 alanine racemase [Mesorhizobium sp. L-8-3]BCH29579.1 alanine racemase [Mesorhizobium sp. L-8-10]
MDARGSRSSLAIARVDARGYQWANRGTAELKTFSDAATESTESSGTGAGGTPATRTGAANAGAILTIDLGAIRENYRRLAARVGGATRCAGVVKADAYGLGAAEVAPALAREGCRTFFVAHVEEGLVLRGFLGAGPDIYVLNGLPPGAEPDCAARNLAPVVNSLEQLTAWRRLAARRGTKLPAALQIDSGMARLGMSPREVNVASSDPGTLDGIELRLVMSHLACADEPASPANEAQRLTFERLAAMFPTAPWSLANSSAIFLGTAYHFDLARPGAALYGINPTPGKPNPMRPVVRLAARVIQTRELPGGTGVGYGHIHRTEGPMRAATISLGYADGWPRHAAAGAFYKGVRLPFAGRVSMDSIILDISALPSGALAAGDLVELIGEHQAVDDAARLAGTIGYEILTGLGHRFHRRYLDD